MREGVREWVTVRVSGSRHYIKLTHEIIKGFTSNMCVCTSPHHYPSPPPPPLPPPLIPRPPLPHSPQVAVTCVDMGWFILLLLLYMFIFALIGCQVTP